MRRTMVRSSILRSAILAIVATGCGGGNLTPAAPAAQGTPTTPTTTSAPTTTRAPQPQATPSQAGGTGIAPCSLITRSEAASAFGSPAAEPEAKGAVCHYDTAAKTKFFDLTARPGSGVDFESMQNMCSSGSQPVAGLGQSSCSANNTVVVLAKGVLILIIAGGLFNQDDLSALAALAVDRLP